MSTMQQVAEQAIKTYTELVERALKIVGARPFYASVENDEYVYLEIDGDAATINWLKIESGYYGDWSREDRSAEFPTALLFVSDAELQALQDRVRAEDAERETKVRAAREASARFQKEAHDRAEYARLWAKFGGRPL